MTGRKFLGPYTSVKSLICHFLPGPARQSSPSSPPNQKIILYRLAWPPPPPDLKNTRLERAIYCLLSCSLNHYTTASCRKLNLFVTIKFARTIRCSLNTYACTVNCTIKTRHVEAVKGGHVRKAATQSLPPLRKRRSN
jgi:hypothetical protein